MKRLAEELYNPLLALAQPLPPYRLHRRKTALLLIDMQRAYVDPECGLLLRARQQGLPEELFRHYRQRLPTVITRLQKLLAGFRREQMKIFHVRIESLTPNGCDRGRHHRRLGIAVAPGSKEAEFVPPLTPREGEVVFSKTASSIFNSTAADYVLRSMNISQLVIGGVLTSGCVEAAVRDGADLGYEVILVEDGCTAVTEQIQHASIDILRDDYAQVRTAEDILDELSKSR